MPKVAELTIPIKAVVGVRTVVVQPLPTDPADDRSTGRIMSEAQRHGLMRMLGEVLGLIQENDSNYDVRYGLVLEAVTAAHCLGYEAGFRIDPQEPEWPVAFIELPSGQVSWHLPQHAQPWDGHDTPEKYARVDDFRKQLVSQGL
jgi:hypothetical protein